MRRIEDRVESPSFFVSSSNYSKNKKQKKINDQFSYFGDLFYLARYSSSFLLCTLILAGHKVSFDRVGRSGKESSTEELVAGGGAGGGGVIFSGKKRRSVNS